MLSTFQIWSSNIYYMDDMFRHVLMYAGWSGDGRPFSDIYYRVLSFNGNLIDIHPMGLISSLAIFSLVMSLYAEKNKIYNNITYSLSCLVLIINPFFISNLWFRFDGPFMLLSVSAAIIPFCVKLNKNIINYIFHIFFIVLSLGLYQSSINIFIAFSAIELLRTSSRDNYKNGITLFLIRAIQAIVALLIYKIMVTYYYQMHEYAHSYSQVSDLNKDGIINIWNNIKISISEIESSFHGLWLFIFPTIIMSVVLMYFSFSKKTISAISLILLATFCALSSSFGLAIVSKNMVAYPRVFVGFGASLFFFMLFITTSKIMEWLKLITISPLIFIVIIFSFASNSSIIGEYNDKEDIAKSLINDIQSKNETNNRCVAFINKAKISYTSELNIKTFSYIQKILPKTFTPEYDGGRFLLMSNGMNNVTYPNKDESDLINKKFESSSPEIRRDTYDIHSINNCTVIYFKP
ncbi:TPA: glucosyltransferase domain-containing protein [Morganella morganii]